MHELAHHLVRHDRNDDDPPLDYAAEEVVVESVAYTVLGALGVDIAAYAIPYLAAWSAHADMAIIEATAALIDRLARRLEDALVCLDQVAGAPVSAGAPWSRPHSHRCPYAPAPR